MYAKAVATEDQRANVVTEYILKVKFIHSKSL
jgi:hypothetical protein